MIAPARRARGLLRHGAVIGTVMALAACGSQSHADRNRAQIDAQLNAADLAMPDGAGRVASNITLGPDATTVGEQMRSSAAHPPAPH